jgi:hypothetical protein
MSLNPAELWHQQKTGTTTFLHASAQCPATAGYEQSKYLRTDWMEISSYTLGLLPCVGQVEPSGNTGSLWVLQIFEIQSSVTNERQT